MDVSFCIVNLNSKLHIQNCLSSISDSIKGMSYEINIADNNSIDGSLDLISMHYSSINLIKNTRNIGYTKAINQLLKVSRGNYLAILNPDTILSDHSIYVQPINYPTVPKGKERLRITPNPLHDEKMIDNLVESLKIVWKQLNISKVS